MSLRDTILDLFVKYRSIIVLVVVLPLSFLFDLFWYCRNFVIQKARMAPEMHDKRVAQVQEQVLAWNKSGKKQRMVTARPGWTTISLKDSPYKSSSHRIKIELYDILNVDTEKKIVRVEPLVNMGQITATLLKKGWTLPVLPEMDDLTVGGLIMGCGIETSSHIYGLFQHVCEAFELVIADGRLVRASRDENPDLFYAVPWSYGTLGFLVAAELRIIPCQPYVHLTYHPFHSEVEFCDFFRQQSKSENPTAFVECIVYSKDEAVVMTGNFASQPAKSGKINPINNWYKPWFFEHVRGFLKSGKSDEFIPLRHYYHRHTRGIFWEMRDIISFGNHPLFRLFLGWLVPPKVSFLKLTQPGALKKMYQERHVIQDMLVPINKLEQSLACFRNNFDLYPLWVCPMRLFRTPNRNSFVEPTEEEDMYVDIGAYGIPQVVRDGHPELFCAHTALRDVEKFVRDVGGFQMLYAETYMDKDEFQQMFNHKLYDRIRQEYNAIAAFPDVYDKVKREEKPKSQ